MNVSSSGALGSGRELPECAGARRDHCRPRTGCMFIAAIDPQLSISGAAANGRQMIDTCPDIKVFSVVVERARSPAA